MQLFLGKDPTQGKWKEWEIQAYLIQEARRHGYFIEGDQNAAKRSPGAAARAKVCGMLAGSPDMRILLPRAQIVFVELKIKKGVISESQDKWHKEAIALDFIVFVIKEDTPYHAWQELQIFLELVKNQ